MSTDAMCRLKNACHYYAHQYDQERRDGDKHRRNAQVDKCWLLSHLPMRTRGKETEISTEAMRRLTSATYPIFTPRSMGM